MKFSEHFRAMACNHIGAMMIILSGAAFADDKLDIGKIEYDSACAICHGSTGKGDGSFQSQLTSRVPDLTTLAKNNNGVFPFDRVYQIIDGRLEFKAHGTRAMPIWGPIFKKQSALFFDNYPPYERNFDSESAIRSRIVALTDYIYRLQAK